MDTCFSREAQGYLAELRMRCGLSLTKASQWLGIDKGNLCRYESSATDMCTDTFLRIVNRYRERLSEPRLPHNYFPAMLKKYRLDKGYSQRAIADMLNVDSSVVNHLEKAENMFVTSYIRVCLAMGIENLTIV